MNEKRKILLVGAGELCGNLLKALKDSPWQPAGIIDNNPVLHNQDGVPVLGSESHLRGLRESFDYALLSLDYGVGPRIRKYLYNFLLELGYKAPAFISPAAHVSAEAEIGAGCIIMPHTIIYAGAKIGENCFIDANCVLFEDVEIGPDSLIGAGTVFNASARAGAGIRAGRDIKIAAAAALGKKCVIANGVDINTDIPAYKIVRKSGQAAKSA